MSILNSIKTHDVKAVCCVSSVFFSALATFCPCTRRTRAASSAPRARRPAHRHSTEWRASSRNAAPSSSGRHPWPQRRRGQGERRSCSTQSPRGLRTSRNFRDRARSAAHPRNSAKTPANRNCTRISSPRCTMAVRTPCTLWCRAPMRPGERGPNWGPKKTTSST